MKTNDEIFKAFEALAVVDIGGQKHFKAYIQPDEAMLLRSHGGGIGPDNTQLMFDGLPAFRSPVGGPSAGVGQAGDDNSIGGGGPFGGNAASDRGGSGRGSGRGGGRAPIGEDAPLGPGYSAFGGGAKRSGRTSQSPIGGPVSSIPATGQSNTASFGQHAATEADVTEAAGFSGTTGETSIPGSTGGTNVDAVPARSYNELSPEERAAVHANTPQVGTAEFATAVNVSRELAVSNPVAAGLTAFAAGMIPAVGTIISAFGNTVNLATGRATPGSVASIVADALGVDVTFGRGERVDVSGRPSGAESGHGGPEGPTGPGSADRDLPGAPTDSLTGTPSSGAQGETETPEDTTEPTETAEPAEFEFFPLPEIPEFVPLTADWLAHEAMLEGNPFLPIVMQMNEAAGMSRQESGSNAIMDLWLKHNQNPETSRAALGV